ncbi:hypothetical protein CTAYLR_006123 [Chrysophaeum taylorii]|uniref:Peptidase S54 rhomboid domain-containing protein n=1 Tax=Chrysophaeum taylorii TaxID=2483200 RepID=A0AAD7XN88_9STRA|nr:hypothetical protein CTAYLR_006123 [Chrysophaeum taylorii]
MFGGARVMMMRGARLVGKRRFIAVPQGEAASVIGGLIGGNVAVYALWQTQSPRVMTAHFTVSTEDVVRKPYTLVSAMFSHQNGYHLLGNMMTLFFFGPEVIYAIGARQFLALYFGAGCVAGTSQLAVSAATTRDWYWARERFLGASGAVNAAVAWSVLYSPWRLIIVFAEFLPLPLPAILYGAVYVGKDAASLLGIRIPYLAERPQSIAHGAHLAGAARLWWIYEPRVHHSVYKGRTPGGPGSGVFAWVPCVMRLWGREAFLAYAGVDATVMIIFLEYAFDQSVGAAALGLVALLPTYYSGRGLDVWDNEVERQYNEDDRRTEYSFSLTTVRNIECRLENRRADEHRKPRVLKLLFANCHNESAWRYVVVVAAAWILTLRALSKLSVTCCEFVDLRHRWLRSRYGSRTRRQLQEAHTVLVERVPETLQSMRALKAKFEDLCGKGSVHSVRIAVGNVVRLNELHRRRQRAYKNLIEARARRTRAIALHLLRVPQQQEVTRPGSSTDEEQKKQQQLPSVLIPADEGEGKHASLVRRERVVAAEEAAVATLFARRSGITASTWNLAEQLTATDHHGDKTFVPETLVARGLAWNLGVGSCCSNFFPSGWVVPSIPYYLNVFNDLTVEIFQQHISCVAVTRGSSSRSLLWRAREAPPTKKKKTQSVSWRGVFWALGCEEDHCIDYDFEALELHQAAGGGGAARGEEASSSSRFEPEPGSLVALVSARALEEADQNDHRCQSAERARLLRVVQRQRQHPMVLLATKPRDAPRLILSQLGAYFVDVATVWVPCVVTGVACAARTVVREHVLCGHRIELPDDDDKNDDDGFAATSTAFVTFTRPTAKLLALNSTLLVKPFGIRVREAPEERDIIWANVHVSASAVGSRAVVVNALLGLLGFFWGAVVALTANAERIKNRMPDAIVAVWVGSLAPVLALLAIMNLLPLVFQLIAKFYERKKAVSEVDLSVVERFYRFQFVNLYVTILSGAVLSQLAKAWADPYTFVKVVGTQTPVAARFFAKFLVVTSGTTPLWLLRAWPLVSRGYKTWTIQPPELPALLYGWAFPKLLLNLMIVMTFWVFAPLVPVIAAVYFALLSFFFRYILLYVHIAPYETGGKFFYRVVERVLFSLGASNVILFFWLLTQQIVGLALLVLPLPFVVLAFKAFAHDAYFEPSKTEALDEVAAYERRRDTDMAKDFDPVLYSHPALRSGPRLDASSRTLVHDDDDDDEKEDGLHDDAAKPPELPPDADPAWQNEIALRLAREYRERATPEYVDAQPASPQRDLRRRATSGLHHQPSLDPLKEQLTREHHRRVTKKLDLIYRGEADYFDAPNTP